MSIGKSEEHVAFGDRDGRVEMPAMCRENATLGAHVRILADKCDLFLSSHIPRHGPLDSPEFGPDLEDGLI